MVYSWNKDIIIIIDNYTYSGFLIDVNYSLLLSSYGLAQKQIKQ